MAKRSNGSSNGTTTRDSNGALKARERVIGVTPRFYRGRGADPDHYTLLVRAAGGEGASLGAWARTALLEAAAAQLGLEVDQSVYEHQPRGKAARAAAEAAAMRTELQEAREALAAQGAEIAELKRLVLERPMITQGATTVQRDLLRDAPAPSKGDAIQRGVVVKRSGPRSRS